MTSSNNDEEIGGSYKVKITCTKLEDLLKNEKALKDLAKSNKDRQNKSDLQYEADIQKLTASAKSYIESELSRFNLVRFDVEIGYRSASSTVHAEIIAVENNNSRKKLCWSLTVDVELPEGDVSKQAGAWKGLIDCTPDKIAVIKQSTEAIELLNTIDWYSLLNMQYPNYEDYNLHLDRVDVDKARNDILTMKIQLLKQFQQSHALLRPLDPGRKYKYPLYFIEDVDDSSTSPSLATVTLLEANGVKQFDTIEELYQHTVDDGIVTRNVTVGSLNAVFPESLPTVTKTEYEQTQIGDRI